MEKYQKSIMEYDDVFNVASWATEKGIVIGRKEGIGIGRKEGRKKGVEIGRKKGVEIGEKRGEKRGKKEGIEIGKKEGERQALIRLVKDWYGANKSISQIAKLLELTEEQVSDMLMC
jgi:predicted transposase YdaD